MRTWALKAPVVFPTYFKENDGNSEGTCPDRTAKMATLCELQPLETKYFHVTVR